MFPEIHSTLRGPNGPVYPQVLKTGDVVLMLYDKGSFVQVVDCNTESESKFIHYRPEGNPKPPIKIDYVWDLRKYA